MRNFGYQYGFASNAKLQQQCVLYRIGSRCWNLDQIAEVSCDSIMYDTGWINIAPRMLDNALDPKMY